MQSTVLSDGFWRADRSVLLSWCSCNIPLFSLGRSLASPCEELLIMALPSATITAGIRSRDNLIIGLDVLSTVLLAVRRNCLISW